MTDANETYGTIMQELNNVVNSDTEETEEEQERFSFHEEADVDDIPPSLLSYFETSKSRAAVCEKLILEELEEDMMSLPTELDKDMVKLNEQVIWDTENEENNTSTDTRLLPAPTETEAIFAHNVSVCPNNEDEAGTDEYVESEKLLAFELRTLEISLNEEDRKKRREYEAERQKRHCEEMKKEEQKRQIERDFQEELKNIMEAEKLHQKELELMEKRAQEKLDQELLLQQELISNLKRRVEEERRMWKEEQTRMREEEDKRKREEEKIKVEVERKRMEEEKRRKKEEERKIEEMKLKKEEERKNEEQERRKREREEKRKREEERNKIDLEKKKLEDELRRMKEEEERKNKEEVERIKKEEEGKREEERRIEEARKKMEKEKRKMEEEMNMKKEEECRRKEEEERKKREEKNKRIEEERIITKEIEERKKQEEMRKKKEEEEADDRNKMYEEMRKSYKREHGNVDDEIKLEERKKKEEKDMKKREEEARKREKETKTIEEKKEVKEVVRKSEGENCKIEEELRPTEEDEKRKQEDEWKTKEEERRRRRQKEEMRRQRDEEEHRKSEEQIRLNEDTEGYKGYDNRKMEHESKTKDKEKQDLEEEEEEEEKKQGKEEMRKRKEERKNVEAEKEQNGEEVGENKNEVNKKTEEEIRLKEKKESKTRRLQDKEKEVRVVKANEPREKRENNSMMGQNEKKNIDRTENSLTSQLEDGTTWTSSTETTPQQHDVEKDISQTSVDQTVYCKNQAARPSTVSVFSPVCLLEHTEQKRLSWMKDCDPWSKLSLQNRRKQKGSVQSRRGRRRVSDASSSLPPLCPDSLLQSTGWKSLQEVTTVTLEDLPGCSLSTLAQCTQLWSLTLRRCGLKSLEGINQLPRLCYIDVQENDISFVDCENMTSLRVLRLAHNKLTSIHGLTGAENLDILDLSYNSITRIAGLESMRRLQRLSVDHNQLISTKGLRDVYTLLYLNCSHNHLANVEGLENSALLNTLDLRANSITEPPSLKNQVLLRELHLDDNSISSLQDLTACWLPLLQHLSVAQNRITQLPSMSDFVSLANVDLRFNCTSELQNVCESLEGCQFLREVHLTGNPLQQESGWRSTLQKAVPGLKAIDDQETDSFLSPPAVQQASLALGSFLTFCQAQLQQTHDLQKQHSRKLSNTSSSLDAVKTSCRHFTEALQLAEDQRFAHEYGDTTVADKHRAAGQAAPEETLDMDITKTEKRTERPERKSTGKVPPVIPNRDNIRRSHWTFEEKSAAESRRHGTFDTVATAPKTGPRLNKTNSGSVHSLGTKGKTISSNLEMAPVYKHQNLDLQNTAAVVIQQLWRKYRQKCGNISIPSTAEKGGGRRGGDGGKPESGPSYINGSQDYAATVIQAFWRGFTLRRRLASALVAVTCLDTGEDDTFEEVDVDEFVFDEAALEKHWTLSLSEDPPSRRYPVSEQPLSLKPPGPFPEPSKYILPPPLAWRSKQAWVAGEQVDSAVQRVSPVSSKRSKSPASTSVVSGLSERSEKILEEWGFTHSHTALLMLKRAQNMKSKKQQQKKRRDPSVRLALFRNCSYQLGPVEARNRQAQNNRNDIKVREAEPGLQQAEKTERVKQERAQQWLHTQAAHPDRDSESAHFLPEISSDILNGGRVQLVADPGYTERLHHASGLWANSSLAAQPRKENSYPRRNSLGHARKEVPSPKRVTSAPSKKERISFRDNPVQLSGGWGGGKKRDKVYK